VDGGRPVGLASAAGVGVALAARPREPLGRLQHEVAPPRRPYLIMNPRAGGGKVTRFGLKAKAEALGATVALLEGPGPVDVAALARRAVAEGADLLGVAGGDGTQALVAGVAAAHDLPLLVISAGTRNHFALDLGLDRQDPSRCLEALGDGVELRVDLGFIAGRPFVNNASFGAYAAVVQSPAYRDDKTRTTLDQLPGLLAGQHGPRLVATADQVTVQGPQAVLVSNNPYGMGDIAGLGRRARLDRGTLGMFAVTVNSAAQAAGLLRGRNARGLTSLAAPEVVIDADTAQIPVGVDGEALQLDTPVRCVVQPAALRVRVPRHRPGVPDPNPSWTGTASASSPSPGQAPAVAEGTAAGGPGYGDAKAVGHWAGGAGGSGRNSCCSKASAARRMVASSAWPPTSIIPMGRPCDMAQGTFMAGWPVTSKGAVFGIISRALAA
jgi:diacylglycerol kinase family enzyme